MKHLKRIGLGIVFILTAVLFVSWVSACIFGGISVIALLVGAKLHAIDVFCIIVGTLTALYEIGRKIE